MGIMLYIRKSQRKPVWVKAVSEGALERYDKRSSKPNVAKKEVIALPATNDTKIEIIQNVYANLKERITKMLMTAILTGSMVVWCMP